MSGTDNSSAVKPFIHLLNFKTHYCPESIRSSLFLCDWQLIIVSFQPENGFYTLQVDSRLTYFYILDGGNLVCRVRKGTIKQAVIYLSSQNSIAMPSKSNLIGF